VYLKNEDHYFHSLRHSYCTWLAETSMPIHAIKRLADHEPIEATMKHIHSLGGGHEHVEDALG